MHTFRELDSCKCAHARVLVGHVALRVLVGDVAGGATMSWVLWRIADYVPP